MFGLTTGALPAWAQPGAGVYINATISGVPILIGGIIKDISGNTGSNLVTGSPSYSSAGTYTLTGLTIGTTYLWTPSTAEPTGKGSLTSGTTTLLAANGAQLFVAASTSAILSGTASASITATVAQAATITISPQGDDARGITKAYNNAALDATGGGVVNTVTLNLICQTVIITNPTGNAAAINYAPVADANGANPGYTIPIAAAGSVTLTSPVGAKFDIADLFFESATGTQTLLFAFI